MISCCALLLSHRPCRLWINQTKHKPWYCKYSPIRLQTTAPVNRIQITSEIGRDTSDASEENASPANDQELIFNTSNDICKHLTSSLCDRGRLPSVPFYCVYFTVNQGGYPVYARSLSSFGAVSANCSRGSHWGCRKQKTPTDDAPKMPLCLHKTISIESLWWDEVSRLSPTASHLPLSPSPPPCMGSPCKATRDWSI